MNKMTFQTNKKENEFEDLLFGGLERNIYSKYLGRIKLSKSEKESKEIIFSKEEAHIFKKSSVEKFMKIADSSEECYVSAKRQIKFVLRSQYDACSNTYSIFNQLQPIISSEMHFKITSFLQQETKSKYEYYKLVAEIKNFRELVFQIPLTIHFPLFSVNCISVREELLNRTDEMLSRVFKSLESEVIGKGQAIDSRHKRICEFIGRKLRTVEDVQEMEKFSNDLVLEKSVMNDRIEEWRSGLFLLIDMDYSISEQTQFLAKVIYQWPKKLDSALDEAYRKHYDDKDIIEKAMVESRKKFKKEMKAFEKEVKIVETYDDLFGYPNYIIPIKEFNRKFQEMKKRKERLETEENILLGFKSQYEYYLNFEKFFEPHYLFWTTAEEFLDKKKLWRGATASTLNVEEIQKVKSNTQKTIK